MGTNGTDNFYYTIDIIQKVATIGSLAFVAYQAWLLTKDYKLKNDKLEREKAIELSKFYCGEVLSNIGYLHTIYTRAGIDAIFGDVEYKDIKNFDEIELNDIFGKSKIEGIEKKLANIDTVVFMEACQFIRTPSFEEYKDNMKVLIADKILKAKPKSIGSSKTLVTEETAASVDEIEKIKDIIDKLVDTEKSRYTKAELFMEFETIRSNTLNLLEYFCMNFNSGIADEETVYQSLHQSFLGVVKLLYYDIAKINVSGKDKYYTNIIKLFNKWASRYKEQQELEKASQRISVHEKKSIKK